MDSESTISAHNESSSTSNKISLLIAPFTGTPFLMRVKRQESVDDLKKAIGKRLKVVKDRICLLYREKQLTDGSLSENCLVEGSRVVLLPRAETGLLGQKSDQSVMQALEGLNDEQVMDFLSGKAPLNLTMRLGDHMMLIQLQLSSLIVSQQQKRNNNFNDSKLQKSAETLESEDSMQDDIESSSGNESTSSSTSSALTEASRALTQTLRQLSSEVMRMSVPQSNTSVSGSSLSTGGVGGSVKKSSSSHSMSSRSEIPREDNGAERSGTQSTDPSVGGKTSKNGGFSGGAIIESMHHHGKGVYSGTFSGSLNPSHQETDGHPKRDITTIIHIVNDLLCAQYKSYNNASSPSTNNTSNSSDSRSKQQKVHPQDVVKQQESLPYHRASNNPSMCPVNQTVHTSCSKSASSDVSSCCPSSSKRLKRCIVQDSPNVDLSDSKIPSSQSPSTDSEQQQLEVSGNPVARTSTSQQYLNLLRHTFNQVYNNTSSKHHRHHHNHCCHRKSRRHPSSSSSSASNRPCCSKHHVSTSSNPTTSSLNPETSSIPQHSSGDSRASNHHHRHHHRHHCHHHHSRLRQQQKTLTAAHLQSLYYYHQQQQSAAMALAAMTGSNSGGMGGDRQQHVTAAPSELAYSEFARQITEAVDPNIPVQQQSQLQKTKNEITKMKVEMLKRRMEERKTARRQAKAKSSAMATKCSPRITGVSEKANSEQTLHTVPVRSSPPHHLPFDGLILKKKLYTEMTAASSVNNDCSNIKEQSDVSHGLKVSQTSDETFAEESCLPKVIGNDETLTPANSVKSSVVVVKNEVASSDGKSKEDGSGSNSRQSGTDSGSEKVSTTREDWEEPVMA